MNVVAWVLQILLAWLCIAGGAYQIFQFDQLREGVHAMSSLPQGLWALLGALGIVEGLGLILPGAIQARRWLTPLAAAAASLQSLLISGLYLHYGDSEPLPYSLTMALLGALVWYFRARLRPLV